MAGQERVRQAFERIVDAANGRRLIPFVGAGLSKSASYTGRGAKPDTANLACLLAKELSKRADSCSAVREFLEGALGRPLAKGAAHIRNLKSLGLAWLAEQLIHIEERGQVTLCQVARIERFRDLEPTAAHRYLVFLAREQAVQEIITTNYDLCLEKAFEESRSGWTKHHRKPACSVVYDTYTYTEGRATQDEWKAVKSHGRTGGGDVWQEFRDSLGRGTK